MSSIDVPFLLVWKDYIGCFFFLLFWVTAIHLNNALTQLLLWEIGLLLWQWSTWLVWVGFLYTGISNLPLFLLMMMSRKSSVSFSFSLVIFVPLKMLLIVSGVFYSSFFISMKVSSAYWIHTLSSVCRSAISKCYITLLWVLKVVITWLLVCLSIKLKIGSEAEVDEAHHQPFNLSIFGCVVQYFYHEFYHYFSIYECKSVLWHWMKS